MRHKFLLLAILFTTLFSCQPINNENNTPSNQSNRTVVAYMMGDVNLWGSIRESVNKMETGWNESIDGKLLVYLDCSPHLTQFRSPVLLEICHDTTDMIVSRVVKEYPDQDPVDPTVMSSVLNDAIEMYPATSHGLIIGGHGSGWLPNNEYTPHSAPSKAISGSERHGTSIDIDQLAEILPTKYDFIVFHACYMSNIETIYQLRNNCNYVMATIVGLLDTGFPYEIITPYFFAKPHADLQKAAELSKNFYAANPQLLVDETEPESKFTVTVTSTAHLEALAQATKDLLPTIDYTNIDILRNFISNNSLGYMDIQSLHILQDLRNLHTLSTNNEPVRRAFLSALDKAVVVNYCVSLNKEFDALYKDPVRGSAGLSFYIPIEGLTELNQAYNTRFGWGKASGMSDRK